MEDTTTCQSITVSGDNILMGKGKEQRRIRNRLSQRTTRERKAAYIRDLEQRLELYQVNKESSRVQELLDENARLRNGLHAARRRLFSIATSLNCAADSLEPLLELKASEVKKSNSAPSAPQSESCVSDDRYSGGEETHNTEREAPDKSHDWATSAAPACPSTAETAFPAIHGDDTFSIDTPEALLIGTDIAGSCSSEPVSQAYQDTLLHGCTSQTFEVYDDANTLVNHPFNRPANSTATVQLDLQQSQPSVNVDGIVSHGALHGGFHSTYSSPMLMGAMSLNHETHYGSALSSHLDCLIKILRRGGIATQYTRAPQLLNDMLDGFLEECWPCMKRWYSITDSYTTVRWVLWWQISQTSEALDDIPETNTPTPVQRALPHPSIIDWIPFASIRNALIISEGYDIDQVFCDITEAFVLQKEEGGTQINETGGVTYKTVVSLLQSALKSAVAGDADSGHGNNVEAEDVFSEGPLKRTKAASSAYCQQLINFGRWVLKLDPSFFQKYPGLYDSTVVASGPSWALLNAPKIQRPKPLHAEAMNTYANLLLKDQNYRTYGMDSRIKHNNWRSNNGLDQWREV